jgi:hypothetical protein
LRCVRGLALASLRLLRVPFLFVLFMRALFLVINVLRRRKLVRRQVVVLRARLWRVSLLLIFLFVCVCVPCGTQ